MKIIIKIMRLIFLPVRILNNLVYGNPPSTIVGYAWYTKDEYQRFLDSSQDDLDILVPTYNAWKENADKRVEEMRNKGWIVFKVQIRIDELNKWPQKHFLMNFSENREKFVDFRLSNYLENAKI